MRAVVYQGPFKVSVENVPDPELQHPNDAIVKITSSCICGSDLHMYEGRTAAEAGIIFGHENMGIIQEVGSAVKTRKVGDRVVMPFNVACGFCKNCQRGFTLPDHFGRHNLVQVLAVVVFEAYVYGVAVCKLSLPFKGRAGSPGAYLRTALVAESDSPRGPIVNARFTPAIRCRCFLRSSPAIFSAARSIRRSLRRIRCSQAINSSSR